MHWVVNSISRWNLEILKFILDIEIGSKT